MKEKRIMQILTTASLVDEPRSILAIDAREAMAAEEYAFWKPERIR